MISGDAISSAAISSAGDAVAGAGRIVRRPGGGDEDRRRRYALRHRTLSRKRDELVLAKRRATEPPKPSSWWPFSRKAFDEANAEMQAGAFDAALSDIAAEINRLEQAELALLLKDDEEAMVLLMGSV